MIGSLSETAAEELGLTTDCLLTAGAHDQYAVALGAGAVRDGDILIGSGTAWVVTAIGDEPDFASGTAQSVAAVPGKWGSLRSLGSGGACLEWWRGKLAAGEGGPVPYETINEEVKSRKAAEEGLYFFPFSGPAGAGQSFRRGSFIGIDPSHDRFDLARAVMEGVVFQISRIMETFRTNPSPEGIKLAGAADILGLPVRIPEVPDLACVGAAVLAGTGCGLFSSVEEGCRRLSVKERVVLPDPERVRMYADCRREYERIAGGLGTVYQL